MRAIRSLIALLLAVAIIVFGTHYAKLSFIKHQIEELALKNKITIENAEITTELIPRLTFSIPDNNKRIAAERVEISQKIDEFRKATLNISSFKLYRKKDATVILESFVTHGRVSYKNGQVHFDEIASLKNLSQTKVGKFAFPMLEGRISYEIKSKELDLKLRIPSLRTAANPDVDVTALSIAGTVILAKQGANGQIKVLVSRFKPSLFKHLENSKMLKKGFGKILQFGSNFLSGMFKGNKVPIIIDYKDGEPRYRLEFPTRSS